MHKPPDKRVRGAPPGTETKPQQVIKLKLVAVNDKGLAIGEDHPRAVLTNHDVDLMLELRAEGYSFGWLAKTFECSKSLVYGIATGRRRGQYAVAFKRQQRRER